MSAWNPRNIMRVGGRLIANPTSLAGSSPYGGTELGVFRQIAMIPNQQNYIWRAEEYGGIPVDAVTASESWVLVGVLSSFDATALAAIFSNVATDGTTQKPEVLSPVIGQRASDRSIALLFAPDDVNHHPFLIMYRVLPLIEESARLRMMASEEAGIPVAFHAIYDASSRLVNWGMRQGLAL